MITYEVILTNTGNTSLTDVMVNDALVTNLTLASGDGPTVGTLDEVPGTRFHWLAGE